MASKTPTKIPPIVPNRRPSSLAATPCPTFSLNPSLDPSANNGPSSSSPHRTTASSEELFNDPTDLFIAPESTELDEQQEYLASRQEEGVPALASGEYHLHRYQNMRSNELEYEFEATAKALFDIKRTFEQ
jgi:hypothetical protein